MMQGQEKDKGFLFWRELGFFYVLLTVSCLSFFPIFFLSAVDLFTDHRIAAPAFAGQAYLNNTLLWAHVAFAVPALAIGPCLFMTEFRNKYLKWHRYLGQVYVICCFISAVTSLPLALANVTGVLPRVGFSSLAVSWFGFTYMAYRMARQKKFPQHRAWMMRSYACTYAFVNVKIYALTIMFFDIDAGRYLTQVLQSCFSWTTNLLVVEVYLAASTYTGVYAGRKIFKRELRKLPAKAGLLLACFGTFFLLSYYLFPMR